MRDSPQMFRAVKLLCRRKPACQPSVAPAKILKIHNKSDQPKSDIALLCTILSYCQLYSSSRRAPSVAEPREDARATQYI